MGELDLVVLKCLVAMELLAQIESDSDSQTTISGAAPAEGRMVGWAQDQMISPLCHSAQIECQLPRPSVRPLDISGIQ